MGASASLLPADTSENIREELKKKHEKYVEEKLGDDEIQQKLQADYNRLKSETSEKSADPKRRGSKDGENQIKRKGSRDDGDNRSVRRNVVSPKQSSVKGDDLTSKASARIASKGTSGKHSGPPTRRRSFDVNQANKKGAPQPPITLPLSASNDENHSPEKTNPPLHGNPSDAAVSPATEVLDSWDSVTQQPYCKICQMAFKSESFLDRHVKFSDLHARNVKKANGESVEDKPIEVPKLLVKQVEGEHYKLIYTGSKFFWRTQDTVDLHMYLHILPNCIEIISFDTNKSKETNRIYIDYGRLLEIIKKNNSIQLDENDEENKRNTIATYILQRLQWTPANSVVSNNNFADLTITNPSASVSVGTGNILVFTKLTGDDYNPDSNSSYDQRTPILDKAPAVLIPIVVTRRRRTNAEEIEATITGLTNDRAALVAATGRAEKIAHLVYAGANAIATKKWYSDFNPVRKRWIWAIRRVIRQKLVAETKKQLKALQDKKDAENRSGKRTSMITKAHEI